MTGEEHIQTEAKAALTHKLNQLGYKPLPEQVSKDRIKSITRWMLLAICKEIQA